MAELSTGAKVGIGLSLLAAVGVGSYLVYKSFKSSSAKPPLTAAQIAALNKLSAPQQYTQLRQQNPDASQAQLLKMLAQLAKGSKGGSKGGGMSGGSGGGSGSGGGISKPYGGSTKYDPSKADNYYYPQDNSGYPKDNAGYPDYSQNYPSDFVNGQYDYSGGGGYFGDYSQNYPSDFVMPSDYGSGGGYDYSGGFGY